MAFNNLTVDFRQLSRIPVRDRAELARSPQASEIFGNMSPSQIAQLVPSYYRNLAAGVRTGAMGGALSSGYGGGGGSGGTAQTEQSNRVKQQGQQQQQKRLSDSPLVAELIKVSGVDQYNYTGTKDPGARGRLGYSQTKKLSPKARALLDAIATDSGGGYGTINYKMAGRIGYNEVTDLSAGHPFEGQKGFTAAGRYQMLSTNYTKFAKKLGLYDPTTGKSDFSPEAQDLIGFEMAKDVYRVGTKGRNLEEDLKNPNIKAEDLIRPLSISYGWHIFQTRDGIPRGVQVFNENLLQYEQELNNENIPGTASVDQQNPTGADQGAIIPLLQGGESAATATVAPAGEVAQRTMILSLGTNDWDNSASTYQNTIDAIKAAQEKGYKVVVVPPVGGDPKFEKVHDLVIQAANESGASIEQPQSYSPDGYHPTGDEYKRIGEKYPGAVVVGDSIANGIGQHVVGGQTVAKDGMGSSVIRTNVLSDDVPKNTAPPAPQTQTFNAEIFSQIDPRLKEEYDKATPEKRVLIERAITKLGAAEVNKIAEKYPTASPIALGDAVDGMYSNVIEKQQQVAGVRRGAITQELKESLSYAADQASDDRYKVELVVTSGGQRMEGAEGATGSHRHDEGGAGDFNAYLIDRETGERILLDPRNPDHTSYIAKTTTAFARVHPSAGVGALYMDDPTKIHFGGDDVSEHGGRARGPLAYAGPDWFKQAHAVGVAQQQQDNEDGYKPKDEWRQKKIEAQSKQVAPTPPGTEPVTPAPQQNDTAVIPLQQGQQSATPAPSGPAPAEIPAPEATPNMKLGGMANLVDEQMTVKGADGQGFNFNQNEEVTIKDGKATVQNEYQKKTEETQRKTDSGMPKPQNQGSMRSSSSTNDFLGQAKHMVVPHSPSAQRHFEASRFNDKHFRGNGSRNMT